MRLPTGFLCESFVYQTSNRRLTVRQGLPWCTVTAEGSGAPEKTNPLLFVENYSLRSHFVDVLVIIIMLLCCQLNVWRNAHQCVIFIYVWKKSNVMNVQVDIDAGRTFRLHADVNVERTSLSLTPDVRSDPMSTSERLPMDVRSALMSTSDRDVRLPESDQTYVPTRCQRRTYVCLI